MSAYGSKMTTVASIFFKEKGKIPQQLQTKHDDEHPLG